MVYFDLLMFTHYAKMLAKLTSSLFEAYMVKLNMYMYVGLTRRQTSQTCEILGVVYAQSVRD